MNYKGNEIASIQDIRNNNPNNKIKISSSEDSDDIKEVNNIEIKNENVTKNFTLKKEDKTNEKKEKEETKKKKKKSFCSIL